MRSARVLAVSLGIPAFLGLAGCFSTSHRPTSADIEAPPSAAPPPPTQQGVPDAIPRVEPRSRYGNPPYYEVFGKRYYVLSSGAAYVERGVASWYGPGFHKVKTSSGELYDMYGMTAAHKTLPLPAYVRVTNLQNGRSVVVRVNDRGPFVGNRLIDLSYTAAAKLDMLRNGTAMVEVRSLDPGMPPDPSAPLLAAAIAGPGPTGRDNTGQGGAATSFNNTAAGASATSAATSFNTTAAGNFTSGTSTTGAATAGVAPTTAPTPSNGAATRSSASKVTVNPAPPAPASSTPAGTTSTTPVSATALSPNAAPSILGRPADVVPGAAPSISGSSSSSQNSATAGAAANPSNGAVTRAPLFVQAGAFADPVNAEHLAAKLRTGSYGKIFVRADVIAGRKMYRVRIGPVPNVPTFDRIVAALEKDGVHDAHLALD